MEFGRINNMKHITHLIILILWAAMFVVGVSKQEYLIFPLMYLSCGVAVTAIGMLQGNGFYPKIILFWLPGLFSNKFTNWILNIKNDE